MPTIEWITSPDRFADLKSDWDKISEGEKSPFLVHDWFEAWWKAFVPEGAAWVCTAWEGDQMTAAFPLWSSGRHLLAMANYQTDTFRPIATNDEALRDVIEAVFSEASNTITLPCLVSTHPSTHLIADTSKRHRRHTCIQHFQRSPTVDMVAEFADYRAFLSSNTRKVAGKKKRKFERDLGAIFTSTMEPDDIPSAMDQFLELEAKGWKGRGGSAIRLRPNAEKFYRDIADRFNNTGALKMGEVRLGDKLVASKLCLLHGNRLYALKEAFDEDYSVFSPSMTLLFAMVEGAYESELEALELLGDAEDMKVRFCTSEHRTLILRSYKPGLISTPQYLFWDKAVPALKPYNDRRKKRKQVLLKRAKSQSDPLT